MSPRLLDLCCKAGGASMGYSRAGFDVTGVDIEPQPRYPFAFVQADMLDVLRDVAFLKSFDAIAASPPCQAHSQLQLQNKKDYVDLIPQTREGLIAAGRPYIIENVEGAPLVTPVLLCGTMFQGALGDLRVFRHRLFESNISLFAPPHPIHSKRIYNHDNRRANRKSGDPFASFVQVTGGGNCTLENASQAMGIDWMTKQELNQAIPPAYTYWLGRQLARYVAATR